MPSYDAIFNAIAGVFLTLLGYIMHSVTRRVDILETAMQNKLDKSDYRVDQQEMQNNLREIRALIANLPQQVVNMLKNGN